MLLELTLKLEIRQDRSKLVPLWHHGALDPKRSTFITWVQKPSVPWGDFVWKRHKAANRRPLWSNLQLWEELQRRPVGLFWIFLVQTALDFSNSSSCAILSRWKWHIKMPHSYKKNVTWIKKSAPDWVEVVNSSELSSRAAFQANG